MVPQSVKMVVQPVEIVPRSVQTVMQPPKTVPLWKKSLVVGNR
jgi:hypothetical protein